MVNSKISFQVFVNSIVVEFVLFDKPEKYLWLRVLLLVI
jgi:hypothetical protein